MSAPLQFLQELSIRQFLAMASNAVLIYDYILTFDLELDYIWLAPWNIVKAIFLLNRYGTLFGQSFLTLEELGLLSHGSRKFCAHFQWFQVLLVVISSETTRTLLLLRAWSLWKCSYRVAISLVSIYVIYVVMTSGFISYVVFKDDSYFHFQYLDEIGVCVAAETTGSGWLVGLISFLLDTGIFAVIGYYLYRLCRESESLHYSPLLRLLVRDAVLFYAVNVFYDVLGILSMSVFVDSPLYFLQVASFPLLVVAGQRAVLNLRGFQSRPYTTRYISRFVDRRIAAMQHHSFLQSVDLWMSDLHEEMEFRSRATTTTTTTTGSHITEEGSSYELEVIGTSVRSRNMSTPLDHPQYDPLVNKR